MTDKEPQETTFNYPMQGQQNAADETRFDRNLGFLTTVSISLTLLMIVLICIALAPALMGVGVWTSVYYIGTYPAIVAFILSGLGAVLSIGGVITAVLHADKKGAKSRFVMLVINIGIMLAIYFSY